MWFHLFAVALKSLTFTSEPQLAKESEGVQIECLFVPDPCELIEEMRSYLGRSVDADLVKEIEARTKQHYRKEGFPIVAVKGNGRADAVVVAVLVGRVGEISVGGARWFSERWVRDQIRLQEGDYVDMASLREDVAWVSRDRFLDATVMLEKGKQVGLTNVYVQVEDQFPLRVYGAYQNTGNLIAGDSRYLAGLNAGNLWGIGHLFDFELQMAPDFSDWWSATTVYKAPLPWRHMLELFGGYTRTKPEIEALEGLLGYGWQVSGRYRIPLRSREHYQHEVVAGYDFKRTNNFLSIDPAQITPTSIDVSQFPLAYQGKETDWFGSTTFNVVLTISPGYMTAFDRKFEYELERPGATPTYAYLVGNVERYNELPYEMSWLVYSSLQLTTNHLIPSEEFALGGYETVRGYNEDEIVSDRGFLLRNEFRIPPWHIVKKKKLETDLVLLGFIDFGYANDVDQDIFDKNSTVLASVGPGARLHVGEYLRAYLDWGYQLHQLKDRPFASETPHRMHAGVELAF